MSEKGGDNFWKNSFLYNISQQIEYINSYPDFIDKMYDRAKAQSSSSIFGDESSFSYKNLYKTSNDYSGLKNTIQLNRYFYNRHCVFALRLSFSI